MKDGRIGKGIGSNSFIFSEKIIRQTLKKNFSFLKDLLYEFLIIVIKN